ncbi:AAA family ATPase [Actinomycetospora endophytica]|uniref:AAA family ATPase n=1 Tax=Actinomycetospora endophytica TaxID=2291215 RepID=A0ABS8P180_9PSEU|nr:LuxR family transcriptional regulator [Actinomycetospora endophytica]MCD2192002.1 AAA family ATPase [Actinomycetospora endophytica]
MCPGSPGPAGAPGPDLYGRDRELAWLSTWYERARAGRAGRALVLGPGGIGKTALVDAFAARAPGAVVVRVEADGDPAAGAFLDLVHIALGGKGGRGAVESVAGVLAELGAVQERGPVVVALHDLHDVDDASAQVLARTFRRLRHDHVLILATSRSAALSPVWTRLFADGPEAGTLPLDGLDQQGVRDLVEQVRPGRWSRAAVTRLHEDTQGHPLHLTTLLRELSDEALLGDEPLPAPRTLADDVATVTERLSPAARRLLACLAVLDRPAGRSLLARFDELASVPLPPAARELADAGLVDGADVGVRPVLRIHHPLVRSAVYAALAPDQRVRVHLDAARAVGGTAALTHRAAAADGRPDPDLASELEAAADADPADGRAGATRLLAAAELSASGAEAERRLLAACLLLVDAYDTDRLRALAPTVHDTRPGPEREIVLGFLASQDFDPAAAVHLRQAFDTSDADREVRALAGVRLALEHVFRGRGRDAADVAVEVTALTRRPIRAEQAVILQAVGRAQHAGPDDGLALLDGHLLGALGADPAITAGTLHLAAGRVAVAGAHLDEGLGRVRRGAESTSTHRAHCHRVEVLYRTGRWDLAEAEADIALDWFADGDRPWAESLANAVAALVPAARAQQDRAGEFLGVARASLARTFNAQGAHAIALAEATLRRALGDAAGMERALRTLPEIAARGGMASAPFAPWRPLHAEALVATGDVAGARGALRSWPRAGSPLWFRLARHQLQARIALATGDAPTAETALRAGIALAERHGEEVADECPVELAELRVLLGSLPHVTDGPEQLAAARPVFLALAATPWLERIRAATAHAVSDDAPGDRTLTPRERQVAGLVALGMTSREAAEALWVTPKAVDYHLGNVYTKLGLTSRRQLRGRSFS